MSSGGVKKRKKACENAEQRMIAHGKFPCREFGLRVACAFLTGHGPTS